jgi:hemoglobin-like flavoprotein
MIQGLVAHYKEIAERERLAKQVNESTDGVVLSRTTIYRDVLHCTKQVPLCQISYSLVNDVVDSWHQITKIPDWAKVTGDRFLRYIFKLEPATIEMFGFPPDTDYRDPNLAVMKGVVLIKAIDTAVQLLGPDVAPLEGVLYDLGRRHIHMKAQPEHWPIVGEALFLVFEEFMEGGLDDQVRNSWTVMYNFLGYHMIQGLKYQYQLIADEK